MRDDHRMITKKRFTGRKKCFRSTPDSVYPVNSHIYFMKSFCHFICSSIRLPRLQRATEAVSTRPTFAGAYEGLSSINRGSGISGRVVGLFWPPHPMQSAKPLRGQSINSWLRKHIIHGWSYFLWYLWMDWSKSFRRWDIMRI
jgi:hypothetical protein